jgi:RimJ/RimL family protein N-acetyltransferase
MGGDHVTAPVPDGLVELRGERVRIRPLRAEETEHYLALFLDRADDARRFNPSAFGPAREKLVKRVETSGRFVDSHLELAIEADGEFAGMIQAHNQPQSFPPGNFMIGIVMAPSARGRGIGREAVALLTSYLFEHEGAERVETPTDVDNVPMRTVNERLGFVLEGVMRSFVSVGAERRDYCMYAMTRDDWETTHTTWTFRS